MVNNQIKELKIKLTKYQQSLSDIKVSIQNLKSENKQAIQEKEKELEE